MKDKILSIQSKLVYGYVGSNIAELTIQLHGLDIIAFPTVLLAAHTGNQPIFGMQTSKQLFDDLVKGIDNLDVLKDTVSIISGYIGTEEILDSVSDFIKKVKNEDPNKLYICDPVMGDMDVGLYLDEKIARGIINKLLPLCNIMTPNHFEFEYIAGRKARTKEDIISTIAAHSILKDKIVIITSCHLEDTAEDEIENVIVKGENIQRITSKKTNIDTTGTGDFFTALVAAKLAQGKDIITAVSESTQTIKRALDSTVAMNNEEMNAKCIVDSIMR